MSKKITLGVLFILAVFLSATFNIFVSAEKAGKTSPAASQASTTIVISQVNGGGGGGTGTYKFDYVELFNISSSPQSLSGLSLQYGSASGQFGSTPTNVFALPDVTLQPGQYYLIQAGTAGTAGADLPVTPDIVTTNLNISGTSGKVALTNGLTPNTCGATATPCALPNAQIVDLVAYGAANNAEGGVSVNNGVAITSSQGVVRNGNGCMDTDNNKNDFTVVTAPVPRNTSSPLSPCGSGTPTPTISPTPTLSPTPTPTLSPTPTPTVTPTPAPLPSPGVVINEIYGGGGNSGATYNQDFVELYNNSSATVDIGNYSLQYASATGVTATSFTVCNIASTDTLIEPGTYFLIATGPISSTVGAALPAANAICPVGINLSSTAGKLALVSGTTQLNATTCPPTGATIVDFVGYGATATCSETSPAIAPSNTTSIQRNPVGTDTNNNSADFASGAPSPSSAATGTPLTGQKANVDFDGDGRSDYVVTRPTDSGKFWYVAINNSTNLIFTQWGANTDIETPADFDGDGKTDFAVWRGNSGNPGLAYFYILNSLSSTVRIEQFGRQGDDPRVVADYDGDGKADPAVYRTAAGGQNYFFYRSSLNGGDFTSVPFGSGTSTRPNVGFYDGDRKADFCVHYDSGGGSGVFAVLRSSDGGVDYTPWGLISDQLAPGDYDGDGKSDFAVVRNQGGQLAWYIMERDGGGTGASPINWGINGDIITPGDYDADGKQDVAVWRANASDATMDFFYVRRSSNSGLQAFEWGNFGDYPAANWYVH